MARPKVPLLSVDRIADAAVGLAGSTGSVTMTELAARLGVRQSSLYNHVSGREEVIELVRRRLHEEMGVRVDLNGHWRDVVTNVATAQRLALARHPWLVPLLATSPAEPDGAESSVENLATVLSRAGFRDEDVLHIIAMIDIIIIGASLDLASPEELYPESVIAGSSDLARIVRHAPKDRPRAEAGFAFTLEIMLDALERLRTSTEGSVDAR